MFFWLYEPLTLKRATLSLISLKASGDVKHLVYLDRNPILFLHDIPDIHDVHIKPCLVTKGSAFDIFYICCDFVLKVWTQPSSILLDILAYGNLPSDKLGCKRIISSEKKQKKTVIF